MSKWLHKVVAILTLFVLVATLAPSGTPRAQAATDSLTESEAVAMLQFYNIVRGNPGGQLDLDQPITRAQAATIFVRTMGFEEWAQGLRDVVPFSDAKGHWAAGEMAMAERLGLMRGDGNGTFRPDSEITYAEMLTVLLRIVKQEPTGAWNPTTIYSTADRLGFAPRGVSATAPALRGKIFWSLASAITQVPLPTGETVMQKYLDQTPPTLALDRASVETPDASTTITGTTHDAVKVMVDDKEASLDSNGRFTYSASLKTGTNTFNVIALDYAGNKATATFTAERKAPIASLTIEGPAVIKSGASTKLTVTAKDNRGATVSLDGVEAAITGDVATFDMRTTTLTALNKTGRGVLTLSAGSVRKSFTFDVGAPSAKAKKLTFASINEGRAPSVNRTATVKVQVLDENGRLVTDDYFRSIRLTATGLEGVSITDATVDTQAGVATFTITGTREGAVTLTASSTGLDSATANTQILTSTRVVLTSSPATLKPDGVASARIQAFLQDDSGKTVTNSSNDDIRITLSASGTDGYFADSYVVIRKGASSSSGDDAYFKAGVLAGTATITGRITSGQAYAVQNLTLPLTGTPQPVRIQVAPVSSRIAPNGTPTEITIQVVDSRNQVVTWGSFAYRLRVTTSNGETVTDGLPEGVSLTFPGLNYGPVYDRNGNNTFVGRTYQGLAKIKLGYNKSGLVTVTPELSGVVDEAYHPTLGLGPASSTLELDSQGTQIVFAGAAAGIELTATSGGAPERPFGAVTTATNITVKARAVDANGAPIPGYTGSVTIARDAAGDKVTRLTGTSAETLTKSFVNGVAEFTLQSVNSAGWDVYRATSGTLSAGTITIAVRKAKPATPSILSVRGVNTETNTEVLGTVAPDDDYMDVQLARQFSPNPEEPTYWVTAKVIRKGSSTTPIISDVAVDLMSPLPVIRIPKSSLPAGKTVYQVLINDGYGWSDPSPDEGTSEAINATYSTAYKFGTNAYFDAATNKLVIPASGLNTTGRLALENLSIVKGDNRISLGDERVTLTLLTSTAITLQLGDLATDYDPAVFNGRVTIEGQDGWFTSADGGLVAKATSTVLLPSANIAQATLDKARKELTLVGAGFSQGTLTLSKIHIGDVVFRPGTTTTTDRISSTADTKVVIALSQATFDALNALPGPAIALTAEVGWLKVTYGSTAYQAPALEGSDRLMRIAVTVTSIAPYNRSTDTITITGKGFAGATIDPSKFTFRRTPTNSPLYRFVGATTATVESDTTITIQLSPEDAAFFESTTGGGFSGLQVIMNTEEGWLVDEQGRSADPLTSTRYYFTVPTR